MKMKAKTPAKKITKPVAKAASKPAMKSTAKAVAKSSVKPIAKKTVKRVTKTTAKPSTKPTAKPNPKDMKPNKKTATPATKAAVAPSKPATKPAATPATKSATKPVSKTILGKPPVSTAPVQAINEEAQMTQSNQAAEDAGASQPITGRGVFAVRTLGTAVSVEAAFLAEDGNVLRLPAVFPNRQYAIEQIDELRALVNRHFDGLEQGGV